jgi:hypothetical protein
MYFSIGQAFRFEFIIFRKSLQFGSGLAMLPETLSFQGLKQLQYSIQNRQ